MSITCVKRNKDYKKRKLVFYDDKRKVCEIEAWWGWICFSKRLDEVEHKTCRGLAMKNLYWLLGHDCEWEDWMKTIWRLEHGRGLNNVPASDSSVFYSNFERDVALNSFYNVE